MLQLACWLLSQGQLQWSFCHCSKFEIKEEMQFELHCFDVEQMKKLLHETEFYKSRWQNTHSCAFSTLIT